MGSDSTCVTLEVILWKKRRRVLKSITWTAEDVFWFSKEEVVRWRLERAWPEVLELVQAEVA